MFNSKQQAVATSNKTSVSNNSKKSENKFLAGSKVESAKTLSGNGALKYSTTNNTLVDQFSFLGSYTAPRTFDQVSKDCELLWAYDKEISLKFMFYLRMITRNVKMRGEVFKNQKGGELKNEFLMRYIWLYFKDKDSFIKNLRYVPAAGCWKDIFSMLYTDYVYHGYEGRRLDWDMIANFIFHGLKDDQQIDLIKKYMPSIVSNNRAKTIEKQARNAVAKFLSAKMFGSKNYVDYRKFKSSGKAHEWQQHISRKNMKLLDFGKIPGRALSKLVKSKFLKNQNLTQEYTDWVTKPETKTVKFTGFVSELFTDYSTKYHSLVSVPKHIQETVNKQFAELIRKGGEKPSTKFIVVRDTSGSMLSLATGINMTCFNIAKSLALYFSEFLTGAFEDHFIEFNRDAKMHQWKGNNPSEKWFNDHINCVGNTNFMSVISLFCKLKQQGIDEADFPTGILCISDGEFDSASLSMTNREAALKTLRAAGFSEDYVNNFAIVLWNLQSSAYGRSAGKKFETANASVPNCFYFSGYSASVISFLTNNIKTALELAMAALDQELIQEVKLAEMVN